MNDSFKKVSNEMRRKELQWNSEKAILLQKQDQLQTRCKTLQERLESQNKAQRILIDSIRQINENDSLIQLNKIECSLDEIKNFNSSQRSILKKYIQDLMVIVQRQNNNIVQENKTKIIPIKNFISQNENDQINNQDIDIIKDNDMNLYKMICWNCQQIFNSKNGFIKPQDNIDQQNQFKKKKNIERINLDNNRQQNNLQDNLSPTQQKSYSIHSIDEDSQIDKDSYSQNSNDKQDSIKFIESQQQRNSQIKLDSQYDNIQKQINKKNYQENIQNEIFEQEKNEIKNFQHKRVNSDSVFLIKPQEKQQNTNKQQELSTPQFDLQKQQNNLSNVNLKSNKNLMEQFVSEMYNSNNIQDIKQQVQNQSIQNNDIQESQSNQQRQLEQSQQITYSNIASLKKNQNQNTKVISFSNIDQIQQEIIKEKQNDIKASIEEIIEYDIDQQDNQLKKKDLKKSEYPFFNLKNFQQEIFGKKESLNSSGQLKTLLSQTSRNYSNAKQQKKIDRLNTREFVKESFIEQKQLQQRLSHSSEFNQNKLSQNLFKQGSNITRHKVDKKFEFQHKKSEGNIPKFNNQQNILKQFSKEEGEYFDVKLDYEIIAKNYKIFQSPNKNNTNDSNQISLISSNKKQIIDNIIPDKKLQKIQQKKKSFKKEKRESSIKFKNMILGKKQKRNSKENLKRLSSQDKQNLKQQPYINYKDSFKIPRFSCKKSFKENQKLLTLQKSNIQKLIPQRFKQNQFDNKYSPKYKSFYKKNKVKKKERSCKKQQIKKDDNFDIKIIKTELIKIPTTIKRVTVKRMKSKESSPYNFKNKKQTKDSLKELQSALNEKFFEINSKIFQFNFYLQQ